MGKGGYTVPHVSKERSAVTFKDLEFSEKYLSKFWALEDGHNTFLRKFGNRYPVTHRQIPEERSPQRYASSCRYLHTMPLKMHVGMMVELDAFLTSAVNWQWEASFKQQPLFSWRIKFSIPYRKKKWVGPQRRSANYGKKKSLPLLGHDSQYFRT